LFSFFHIFSSPGLAPGRKELPVLGHRIKLDDDLLEKVKKCAVMAGYSSPDEFVIHVLEKEVEAILGSGAESDDEEEVRKRLKGLGYIE
jgi:hypothetical protein